MLKLWRKAPQSHEDLFLERYGQMLAWALQLTGHDRRQAEDLVHDVFIQFSLRHPDLHEIQNLEGYLFTMLRNMQRSQVRRAARTPSGHLSLVDFDSAELGLHATDPRGQMQVLDELGLICRYACVRRETSKAGSVLILRFFHGYYPSEIAQVLQSSRQAVADLLRVARHEVKLYLEDPSRLAFMKESRTPDISPALRGRSSADFLSETRAEIFRSRQGDCYSRRQLRELYSANPAAAIDAQALGHIVSCDQCLEEVNRLLGLAPLSERYPTDTLGPDTRPKGGAGGPPPSGPSGPVSTDELVKRYRRKVNGVFEHTPKELRISVNGFILGAQKVNARLSELTLSIDLAEKLDFVEVFSEQGVRLLFLNIEPPPEGTFEQQAQVRLSDGRTLDTTLSFSGPWPSLHVVYSDPTLALESGVKSPESVVEDTPGKGSESTAEVRDLSIDKPWTRAREWFDFRRLTLDWRLFLRPGTVTAILSIIVMAVLLFVRLPPTPLSAADLLRRSAVAEEAIAARTDQVLHRTITLEEKSATGQLIARKRIESWQSAAAGVTARRLYDERGALILGDWRRADGVQTLYQHRSRPQLQLVPENRVGVGAALSFDNAWQQSPSAKEFVSLVGPAEATQLEERATSYVISYAREASDAPGLVRATLVLSRADLHAVEETLFVQQGSERREYRFVEVSYERRPTSAVAPAVFEPEPELLGIDTGTRGGGDTAKVPASPHPTTASPVMATAELEVEVLERLNQAGGFFGEQLSLTRTPEGRLRVEGILETTERKSEILRALGPVATNPAVSIAIETVAEAQKRQPVQQAQSPVAITTQPVEVTEAQIPVYAELRGYLSGTKGLSNDQIDQEMRHIIKRVLNRSIQARLHALALKQIVERFSPADLQAIEPDARRKWRSLINEHAQAFRREISALRRELEPILPVSASSESSAGIEITNDADLARAVKRLFELASANDEGVSSSFSLSAGGGREAPVKSAQFWRSFRSAERLAEKIQNAVTRKSDE